MSAHIRFRPRITKKKHVVFFLPSARIRLLPISEKKPVDLMGIKKHPVKKTSSFREIKHIFPAMFFFACFFSSPLLSFLKIGQKLFFFRRPH